ncbi:glycosyltransferase family 1 protein [Candidatus Parcubacteria bacterium]|nr:MAG: glycosyltransferase family 1 protein [Candidatus Parcubacteria bacterium]
MRWWMTGQLSASGATGELPHILVFSLAYRPVASGAEIALEETTSRIPDIRFTIITRLFEPNAPREETIGNVRVVRVGFGNAYISKMLFVLLAALKARALARRERVDGMWALMTYMLWPTVLAYWLGVRVPWVVSLQDGDPYEKVFERWFVRPFVWILDYGFRRACVAHAISRALAEWPSKRGSHVSVVVIPNAVDEAQWRHEPTQDDARALRRKLGLAEDDCVLFNAARLVYQKGHDTVIRALTRLPERVKYVIAGEGADREKLEALAKEFGVAHRVIFLGVLPREEVPRYRNPHFAQVFIGLSRSEGLGNSFLSAMAGRVPVVATHVGGLADFVFDEKRNPDQKPTAWVVDPDDSEGAAAAVRAIMENPEKARAVAENARKFVEENFRWDVVAKRVRAQVLEPVVAGKCEV